MRPRREHDRAGTGERRCLKLNKTGPYPEEVTAAKDRDKAKTVPHGHDYMCRVATCLYVSLCALERFCLIIPLSFRRNPMF